MVSDITYYCRIKGLKNWDRFDEHPGRLLKGVAGLYADFKGVIDGVIEVRTSLESSASEFIIGDVMTEGDLFQILQDSINEYRLGANDSLRINSHMNAKVMEGRENIPQEIIDALLVDFVNYYGGRRGGDYGLYTGHLRKR